MQVGNEPTDDPKIFGETVANEDATTVNKNPQFLVRHLQGYESMTG